ncbi:MAG: ferritin-like domain-containing protein [Vicinamibacteria bacterium]
MKSPSAGAQGALIAVLQAAYSGEMAAGFAYAGHWRSVKAAKVRDEIRAIEAEEWHHRKMVGEILTSLGARPSRRRERIFRIIGRTLGPLCRVSGWLLPMWGAGFLESHNVVEYEVAARLAEESGHGEFIDELLRMAEVEWEHERYFRERVLEHRFARLIPIWKAPPPKDTIRGGAIKRAA